MARQGHKKSMSFILRFAGKMVGNNDQHIPQLVVRSMVMNLMTKSVKTSSTKQIQKYTLPETNSSPLKIDPWNLGDSYWKPPFLGAKSCSFQGG